MKKFILLSLIFISFSSVGCRNVYETNNKEVIIIDEVANETSVDEDKIETKLIYKIPIEISLRGEEMQDFFVNKNIFEISSNFNYELKSGEQPMKKINKVRMGKVDEAKDSTGLNNITWEDIDIEGYLLSEAATGNGYKIIKDNKIYNLGEEGELIEIKSYEGISEGNLNNAQYYHNLYNDETNILFLNPQTKLATIDLKNNKVKNANENLEEFNIKYNIFKVEDDKTYVWYLDEIKDKEYELKIGYIKDNNFYNIFDEKNLFIQNQRLTEIVYGYAGENKVLFKDNKILFSGIINGTNGIWNYDINSKELSLQMELEENMVSYMYLNKNKDFINISTTVIDDEDESKPMKYSQYIGKVNEDFKITGLNNITYNAIGGLSKHFVGFYDANKIIYSSNLEEPVYSEETYLSSYEIYEIVN